MDIDLLVREYDVYKHLMAIVIGMPRLFVIMMVVPFMASGIVTGQLRLVVVAACSMFLHPAVVASLPPCSGLTGDILLWGGVITAKEILVGFLIGYLAGMPFWAAEGAGFLIDNQRGAGQAAVSDAMSGDETSPFGSFLIQSAIYVFFATGSFLAFLGLVYASYEIWPVASLWPDGVFRDTRIAVHLAEAVARMMKTLILIAAPVVVACLVTDVSLGLINRFVSQMNVYVLAMPVKSAVSVFLLLLYYAAVVDGSVPMFRSVADSVRSLERLIP